MLRRRLLIVIIPLVSTQVLTALIGYLLLQNTLWQFSAVGEGGLAMVENGNDVLINLRDARRDLHELAIGHPNQLAPMSDSIQRAKQLLLVIEQSSFAADPALHATLARIDQHLPWVEQQIKGLSAPGADLSPPHAQSLILVMDRYDPDVSKLSQMVRDRARIDFQKLSNSFRMQLVLLSAVAILVINFWIVALLRMGAMILPPVDKMVAVAREVGQGKFDRRVQLETDDEFGQMAQAYNRMAEALEAAEGRRMEVLAQVALTMSHELNNVVNIIELQLTLVSKHAEDANALEGHLKRIRQSLKRMTDTVDELRRVRRIVLTDYVSGMKMINLRRSIQAMDTAEGAVGSQDAAEPHL